LIFETSSAPGFLAGVILLATMLIHTPRAAEQPGTLRGTLLDPQGAAVPKVDVEPRWNDASQNSAKEKKPRYKNVTTKSDMAGELSLKLPPGDGDVFAYHDGFATTVFIETGKVIAAKLRFPGYAAMSIP